MKCRLEPLDKSLMCVGLIGQIAAKLGKVAAGREKHGDDLVVFLARE